ncbi:DNA replication factor Dna2, partial [Oesophagostomum dentatum]
LIVKEVKGEDGLVDLICRKENGDESIVYLQDQWAELCVEPNTRIRLIGAQQWGQSAVLNERFRGPVEANKAMLIGTIMHELFQAAVTCPAPKLVTTEWLLEKWQNGLRDDVIAQLVALRFTPSQFETELMPYADVIVDWVQTHLPGGASYSSNSNSFSMEKVHDIEENIWVPQLGIKGKVDVTLKVKSDGRARLRPLELKTGKSGPSSEHAAQVMLYNLMLSSRHKQLIEDGSLLYLKDGVTREVRPRALELKGIINQRNSLATHLSKLDPDSLPAPRSDPKFCGRCDHASTCSFYQVTMEPPGRSTDIMFDFAKARMSHLSESHLEYFKKWIRWIYREWAEDKNRKGSSIKDLWRKSPEERESDGFCAASLRLSSYVDTSTEVSRSYLLTFQSSSKIPHMVFAPGNMCTVSTSEEPGLLLVPVIESTPNSIIVRSDKMLDKEKVYHVDLYNSFSTYSTTLGSLVLLMGSDESSSRLREIIVDLRKPLSTRSDAASLPRSVQQILAEDHLNEGQRDAIRSSLLCSDYTLIEGFPGSGKTTTIVALLRCLLEMKCSILLTTNTHSALDNVLCKLRKYIDGSKILRLGKTTSGRSSITDLTLDAKLSSVEGDKYTAARDILKNTPLVASTCHYVPRDVLFSWRKFDYCIVDEASMVLEPVVLPSLTAASRFVLVGDAHQLTPLVQNRKCAEEGMAISLFERLQVHTDAVHSLVSQYRMNRTIARLSSHLFYEDRLVCGSADVAKACLADSPDFKTTASGEPWRTAESGQLEDSVVFVDTQACAKPDFAMSNESAGMTQNMGEAQLACDVISQFVKNGVSPCDIGVMCVYRKQVDVIRSLLDPALNIEVNSVDQYQGRDKSVVTWSLVWTNTSETVGDFYFQVIFTSGGPTVVVGDWYLKVACR